MNLKVKASRGGGVITLTDKNYRAAGGEANIYTNGGMLFKVYHDANKVLPLQKIQELAAINNAQVIVPKDQLVDASSGKPIGYIGSFIDHAEPLMKLFTRTFKDQNSIDIQMVVEFVKKMQLVTTDIHKARCLISDYNELNILFKTEHGELEPYFIDVDSYVTPSYKAVAIMDSVRDRRVSSTHNGHLQYNPDTLSDWFSWGILAFWAYSNIHPFRGRHDRYKPREMVKQMDDGVSVFHKGVRVPPSVNDFKIIPKRHLDWFIDTFRDNHRSIPPLPDSSVPLAVPTQIVTIRSTASIEVDEWKTYSEPIRGFYSVMGVTYAVGKNNIYSGDRAIYDCSKAKKVLLCSAYNGVVVAGILEGITARFIELQTKREIGTIAASDMFVRNNAIYTMFGGKLVENFFPVYGSINMVHSCKEIASVSMFTAKVYEGCIIQDLLGRKFLTLPYELEKSSSIHLSDLDSYRIIEAKAEDHYAVILAEKGGKYDRFIITFSSNYGTFYTNKVEDVAYEPINFTVSKDGLFVLLSSPDELSISRGTQGITIKDPPFDVTMKLCSTAEGIFFINNNSVHQIKKK